MSLLLLFVLVVGLVAAVGHIVKSSQKEAWSKYQLPFDSAVWKANPKSREMNPIRLRMVDNLLEKQNFIGMTRKQIDELLGYPTPTDMFGEWDLVFWLGPNRGVFRIDSEWLVFRFDDKGKVKKYALVQD